MSNPSPANDRSNPHDPYESRNDERVDDALALLRLDGRVAVVIGGTGVLGSRIAATYAQAGAEVVIVGRDAAKAQGVLDVLSKAGLTHVAFEPCDVSSRAELASLVQRVVAKHGRVDVLVNGAGVNSATPFLDINDDELNRIVDANFLAVVRSCQEFGRHFVSRAGGASIINVGSASGITPLSRVFTYSATKAAVHNLTKNLAREWGPHEIRVNVLVPGFFPAEQNRKILSADRVAAILGHTPMGRFGDASELAGAALLLASDAGRFITGTELVVDGGFGAMTI
jgi:NAD(P)-dependent dehydrogenase (short-subunit alcohol dehydrogenase family)